MILPKHLKKVDNGRIFVYDPILAKRSDMIPVWEDGVDPNVKPKMTGLEIQVARDSQADSAMAEKEQQVHDLQAQVQDLLGQLNEANETIQKLNAALKVGPTAPEPVKAQRVDADPERFGRIVDGVKKLMQDPNNMTGGGKVRIEPLEDMLGITDITAAERDAAMGAVSE